MTVAASAFADSKPSLPSQAGRIADFINNGGAPSFCQQLPGIGTKLPTTSSSEFSWTPPSPANPGDFHWSSDDFSSLFSQLSAGLSHHDFNPEALNQLQSLVDSLRLPPSVQSKIETILQDVENHFQNDNESDSDDSAENDKDEGENEDLSPDETPTAVPEPNTFALVVAGAALLGGTLLRRRAR